MIWYLLYYRFILYSGSLPKATWSPLLKYFYDRRCVQLFRRPQLSRYTIFMVRFAYQIHRKINVSTWREQTRWSHCGKSATIFEWRIFVMLEFLKCWYFIISFTELIVASNRFIFIYESFLIIPLHQRIFPTSVLMMWMFFSSIKRDKTSLYHVLLIDLA